MPGKRVSVAAGLKAPAPSRKAGRTTVLPLVACAKRWGSADWVFEGALQASKKHLNFDDLRLEHICI